MPLQRPLQPLLATVMFVGAGWICPISAKPAKLKCRRLRILATLTKLVEGAGSGTVESAACHSLTAAFSVLAFWTRNCNSRSPATGIWAGFAGLWLVPALPWTSGPCSGHVLLAELCRAGMALSHAALEKLRLTRPSDFCTLLIWMLNSMASWKCWICRV